MIVMFWSIIFSWAAIKADKATSPARMMCLRPNSPDHDRAAGDLREHAALDIDGVRPEPYLREVRVVVVADPEAHLAEADEAVAHERDILGRRHLNAPGIWCQAGRVASNSGYWDFGPLMKAPVCWLA